jgi:transcriptional regulator with PAS, ATPase and Fis domain
LLCATNLELKHLADESKFRKDLIYRINTVDITVPPLRYRGADITLLAKHFVKLYGEKYDKQELVLAPDFIQKLKNHPYPGNVRELQYAIERAVIMTEDDTLSSDDLTFSAIEQVSDLNTVRTTNLEEIEKHTILSVIEKNSGNISKSAKELGLTRTALYRRLNKYDL